MNKPYIVSPNYIISPEQQETFTNRLLELIPDLNTSTELLFRDGKGRVKFTKVHRDYIVERYSNEWKRSRSLQCHMKSSDAGRASAVSSGVGSGGQPQRTTMQKYKELQNLQSSSVAKGAGKGGNNQSTTLPEMNEAFKRWDMDSTEAMDRLQKLKVTPIHPRDLAHLKIGMW